MEVDCDIIDLIIQFKGNESQSLFGFIASLTIGIANFVGSAFGIIFNIVPGVITFVLQPVIVFCAQICFAVSGKLIIFIPCLKAIYIMLRSRARLLMS